MTTAARTKGIAGEVDAYVGKNLFKLRQMAGLSQEDLARVSRVSFQQIQKYEKGTNRIAAGRLYEFSKILGVTPNDFYTGYDDVNLQSEIDLKEEEQKNITSIMEYPPELVKVIKLFSKVTDPEDRIKAAKNMATVLKIFTEKQRV